MSDPCLPASFYDPARYDGDVSVFSCCMPPWNLERMDVQIISQDD